jgi:hypothetical protein
MEVVGACIGHGGHTLCLFLMGARSNDRRGGTARFYSLIGTSAGWKSQPTSVGSQRTYTANVPPGWESLGGFRGILRHDRKPILTGSTMAL